MKALLLSSGACRVAYTAATAVPDSLDAQYAAWLDSGKHAGMDYLARHRELRRDPATLLEGARTVICAAFNYYPPVRRDPALPEIAFYAYGMDYHDVVRKRLKPVLKYITDDLGARCRLCVDSAPIAERFWARKANLGFIGRNGALILPGIGSFVFLVEILTTLSPEEVALHWDDDSAPKDMDAMDAVTESPSGDEKGIISCLDCGACVKRCPTGALCGDGTLDARRCLSYLTIEHSGEFSPEQKKILQKLPRIPLFGCDLCLRVCPHNINHPTTDIPEFFLFQNMHNLSYRDIEEISSPEEFSKIFSKSPIKRAKLQGLRRNLGGGRNRKTMS